MKKLAELVASFSRSGRKGALLDVKEDDSYVTLACEDDVHKVVLCAHSIFFKIRYKRCSMRFKCYSCM